MIRDIAFILAGYAAGSILFAKVFCSLLKKTDVAKNTKDNNPGTSNAFKNGGILCGALTLICDVTKGFLPVFFYTRKEVTFLLALVIAAPVIGHVFSVFNGFRGGKGIATTFGCLFGLFPNLIPFAIFADVCFFLFYSENKSAFSQDARDIFFHGASNRYFCGEPDCLRGLFLHSRGSLHQVSDK